jgi:HAD superfamily hydrolase (TIGR01490 family)
MTGAETSTVPAGVIAAGSPQTAAFFDVDGTLVHATIAHYFAYLRRKHLRPVASQLWYVGFLIKCGYYIVIDRIDRTKFNHVFYRNYAGMPVSRVKGDAADCFREVMLPRLLPAARECVEAHRRKGHRLVLVTGSLDFLIEPLARELGVDEVVAASLEERGDRFTGALATIPLSDAEKARRLTALSVERNIDLASSHAYGDSIADLPMLEAVGFGHAVNPDDRLLAIAESRGWPVHRWRPAGETRDNGR